ncbi:unnamed protein product [Schistosoma rodhaini]|uniref:Uncharacterized protein n=1 Tax=Schistosoma rodhaini TaxID=6188 RepID=A0AA85EWA4_9TREM|nr:unnamed protein product [Schistosoma rodhaini]CAH8446237.1 unnamed protein product [Schistosoma rodhaini]
MNAKMKVDTIDPQRTHSNAENVPESEVDTSDLELSNPQYDCNVLRRNLSQESSFDKCTSYSIPNTRCSDISIRGKERFPLRAVSTNSRTASRRSLNKWVSGVHRLKPANSINNTNAFYRSIDFGELFTAATSEEALNYVSLVDVNSTDSVVVIVETHSDCR